jgi:RNA polymerase sigma factor (sigma-70 family)
VDDDFALVRRWRDGDASAGNQLFHRHFVAIRRFFRNKVTSEDAEDLIQRTLLQCVESVEGYRGDGSFRAYLYSIARYVFLAHVRQRQRDAERHEPDLSVSSVLDLGPSPSVAAVAHEQQGLLVAAMQRIPVDFQITLELFYWEQLSGPEIAEVLGISATTVRTRLLRARTALRDTLATLRPGKQPSDEELEASVTALRNEA